MKIVICYIVISYVYTYLIFFALLFVVDLVYISLWLLFFLSCRAIPVTIIILVCLKLSKNLYLRFECVRVFSWVYKEYSL